MVGPRTFESAETVPGALRTVNRRTLLGGAATIGVALLGGCLGGDTSGQPTTSPTERPTPTASPTPEPSPTATASPSPTLSASPTTRPAIRVDVGPDRSLRFEPRSFTVGVGEPVAWVFRSIGHNVKPQAIPADAEWTGTPGGDVDTVPVGFVHRHAFSVPGEYEYMCVPHLSSGMVGAFTVEA